MSGTIFKIERGPAGEKIAYVRLRSGTVRVRDRLPVGDDEAKVTGLTVFDQGTDVVRPELVAGQIGKLRGLGPARIGDRIGAEPRDTRRHFAPPTLETVVLARRPADRGRLHLALTQLAEQDPLIDLGTNDVDGQITVSLYGEVHKQILQATLADEFGVAAGFRESTTLCIERPVGSGEAVELMEDEDNPFRATVGLRVDPAAVGSGVRFHWEIELGSLPYPFLKAVEESMRRTLRQGLSGWQVTDCTVTLTHSGYVAPPPSGWSQLSSSAGDFRRLTPLVLMSALSRAGTRVYEPVHRLRLEVPPDTYGAVVAALNRLAAVPQAPTSQGASYVLEGTIAAAQVHELRRQLPGLTRGEGVAESAFDHYAPATRPVPVRPRPDHHPLDREAYLLHAARRV